MKIYDNFKSKITIVNWLFLIPAIIHFVIVCFVQYNIGFSSFNTEQKFWYITSKLVAFFLLIFLYQLIPAVIKGFRNQDNKIKDITKYFLIYFIPNLVILFLVWPGCYYIESISTLEYASHYQMLFFVNWLQCLYVMIAYNCIPHMWGISLFNIFVFSLLIAIIIYSYKVIYENRFAFIIFIPFFIPMIICMNTMPIRLVNGAYLAILLFYSILFLYKTREKTGKKYPEAIFLAILCSIYTSIRVENIVLILLLPIMIYLLKLFDLKRYAIFLFIFLFLFCTFSAYEKIGNKSVYELHNLTIIYNNISDSEHLYSLNKKDVKILENLKDSQFVKEKFIDLDWFNYASEIEQKTVKKILSKYVILNIPTTLKMHVSEYLNNYPFLYLDYFIKCEVSFNDRNFYDWFQKSSKFLNENLRYKTFSYLLTGTSNFKSNDKYIDVKLSNAIIPFCLLIVILISGIISKNYFYIYYVVCHLALLISLFSSIPFLYYFYTYPFTLCTYFMFMTIAASVCKYVFYKYLNYCKNKL